LKLLADGKLYAADENLNKKADLYYQVIKILRSEDGNSDLNYERQSKIHIVDANTNRTLLKISVEDFKRNAILLLDEIKKASGSSFSVPKVESFMQKIKCKKLKAKSTDKSDIKIVVHDEQIGTEPTLGFSIKSSLGSSSTLLNAGNTTNFIFRIKGNINDATIRRINSISTLSKIRDRLFEIDSLKCSLEYVKTERELFCSNLQVIDTKFPEMIACSLLSFYKGKASKLSELVKILESENPCNFNSQFNHKYYEYKIKAFLTDVSLGMTPAKVWNGKYDATGGYIIVKDDGEILCYHIYNRNEFQEYLLKNTKFDTASTTRYDFGKIYKGSDGNLYFKLNLQIRFI
jgi:type II restriction enzyme